MRARVCQSKCLANEESREFLNRRRDVIMGYETGVDYRGNDIGSRFTNVLTPARCQELCSSVDGAVMFTHSAGANVCFCKRSDSGWRNPSSVSHATSGGAHEQQRNAHRARAHTRHREGRRACTCKPV